MNKRLVIIVGIVATILLIVLLFGKNSLAPQQNLYLSQPIATNFRYPAQFSAAQAYYFNGSTFLSYDLASQTSKALSPVYSLPNVLDVQWSKDGALFKANDYSVLDQLKPILDQKRLPTNAAYWWLVTFATGELKLVGTPAGPSTDGVVSDGVAINSAIWASDGQSYYYVQTEQFVNRPAVNTVFGATPEGTPRTLASIEGNTLVWAGQDRIIYKVDAAKSHSLNMLDAQTHKISVLYQNFNGPAYVNTGGTSSLVIPTATTSPETLSQAGPLKLLSFNEDSPPRVLSKNFTGSATWSHSAEAWAAVQTNTSGALEGYIDDASGKVAKLSFKLGKGQTVPSHLRVIGYEADRILLLDSKNYAYLASIEPLNLKAVVQFTPSQWNYTGTGSLMTHGLTNVQLSDLKYALYQFAQSSGQNPQKIDITNVTIEPFDRKNPAPKAVANFTITLDKQNRYTAKLEYFDLTSIRLYLYDPSSNAVKYDSGTINKRNVD